jgi:hypothetical protein
MALCVKINNIKANNSYSIESFYKAIKDKHFSAGVPSLTKYGAASVITFPAINGIVKLFGRTMFFLPCYEFGRFYKAVLEKKDTLNNVAYFAIIFVVQLILLTFCEELEYTPSSFTNFNNGFVKISRYKYKQCQIIRIRREPVISKFHSAMITMSGNYNDNSDGRQKFELQIHPSVSINATQISTLFQNSTLLNF